MSIRNKEDINIIKQRIIRGIYEGNKLGLLLETMGVKNPTFYYWLKVDPRFSEGYRRADKDKHKRIIYGGLEMLASGYQETIDRDEWIEENNEGDIIKKSRTTKQVAPNIQAIMKLSNKYTDGELSDDSDSGSITIRITQKDRSLTLAERLLVLEGDKSLDSLDDIAVDAKDIKHLEGLSLDPPTKD